MPPHSFLVTELIGHLGVLHSCPVQPSLQMQLHFGPSKLGVPFPLHTLPLGPFGHCSLSQSFPVQPSLHSQPHVPSLLNFPRPFPLHCK